MWGNDARAPSRARRAASRRATPRSRVSIVSDDVRQRRRGRRSARRRPRRAGETRTRARSRRRSRTRASRRGDFASPVDARGARARTTTDARSARWTERARDRVGDARRRARRGRARERGEGRAKVFVAALRVAGRESRDDAERRVVSHGEPRGRWIDAEDERGVEQVLWRRWTGEREPRETGGARDAGAGARHRRGVEPRNAAVRAHGDGWG